MPGITMKEVALRAGVSHQTVSNVLNGVSVKPETQRRVSRGDGRTGFQSELRRPRPTSREVHDHHSGVL
ncbi:MAG: LacI family transcriptional regulator [Pleurocapsa sp. SU_196_0]|nr:LacI family transcriptional regulator [Pleurocapsa sp. SU_196_0]